MFIHGLAQRATVPSEVWVGVRDSTSCSGLWDVSYLARRISHSIVSGPCLRNMQWMDDLGDFDTFGVEARQYCAAWLSWT